jgi:hypothetical protein
MDQSLEIRIRERAYEIWTEHGCVDGQAQQQSEVPVPCSVENTARSFGFELQRPSSPFTSFESRQNARAGRLMPHKLLRYRSVGRAFGCRACVGW